MAICKHVPCRNGFAAAGEYLTMQHDVKGRLLRDGDGHPRPRAEYLIDGINCIPETFAPLCLEDQLRFGKKHDPKVVDTHQYIISFAPSDRDRGLTMEKAHRFGYQLAQQNFPGHRALVCTHPDGENHSGNIHVHIVISSLRFEDRPIDPRVMRLGRNGSVKPSEYRAGCAHQDSARLRNHLMDQINDYCKLHGYILCPDRAAVRIKPEEYFIHTKGLESRHDQLRRAISDAAATTHSWEAFSEKLETAYTRYVPVVPPIPYPVRNQLWAEYKKFNTAFRNWSSTQRASLRRELDAAFQELKSCKNKGKKEMIRKRISDLKALQAKERLFRQTYQAYSKGASLALQHRNQEDAQFCLEQMKELFCRQEGYWQEGWNRTAGSYSLLSGSPQSRVTWKQITVQEWDNARKLLDSIQEDSLIRKMAASELMEEPMPIEVKLSRGAISFRHPDSECWVRGKRPGENYTLKALGVPPPKNTCRTYHKVYCPQR